MIKAVKENKLNPYVFQTLRQTMEMKEIAKAFGYKSVNSLYCWCYRNNVETKRITDWEVAEDIGEMTVKEIAYKYNVSIFAVYRRLSKMGICTKQ